MRDLRAALLDGSVEVKCCRAGYDSVFVELNAYSRRSGVYEASGLSTTESSAWAFCVMTQSDEIVSTIIVPTEKLRRLIEGKPIVDGARGSRNPTRGVLISHAELIRA